MSLATSSAALRRGRSTNQSAKSRSANRRRRWYLGIQSKKDPGHVMTEVLHALGSLAFSWILLSPFRIKGKWTPPQSASNRGRSGEIKVIFQLYKVQSGIYLLDFQRCSGDVFSFMALCSKVINELKLHPARLKIAQILGERN